MFQETVTVAAAAVEHHQKLRELAQRLWKRITKGQVRVVVFGAGGSGKTTLGKFLAGDVVSSEYRESAHMERYELEGTTPCTILVPPGQELLRPRNWKSLQRYVSDGRATSVIHVVSDGHVDIQPARYIDHRSYQDGMSVAQFVPVFLQAQRDAEVRVLGSLARELNPPNHLSLVTVVLKQDLWWPRRNEVRAFYENGAYAEQVDALRKQVGDQKFSHQLWSASLLRRNLKDGDHTLLVPVAEGYDDAISDWHAMRLLELVQKEVGHVE